MTLDEQSQRLVNAVVADPVCAALMERLPLLGLEDWWLTGGAVFQNVWNAECGHRPGYGVKDYDVFYYDGSDLSWDAEDAVIRRATAATSDLSATIEIKNEARAHLWIKEKWGHDVAPFARASDAIDTFVAVCCMVGIRFTHENGVEVYAPQGLADVFDMVMRPSPTTTLRNVYELKAAGYQSTWPQLRVAPF